MTKGKYIRRNRKRASERVLFFVEKIMLKSCKYCGKIHDNKIDCGKKPVYRKKNGRTNQFHSSSKWTETSKAIKSRDHYLCQACLNNLDGNGIRYTTEQLEVHHIIPIAEVCQILTQEENVSGEDK